MKVISISQPFASLIVKGCKIFETRTWVAPRSIIGQRIGIASTKGLVAGVKDHCEDEVFKGCFARTGLGEWTDLPRGYLLGTVILHSIELMTEEFMDDVSTEEQSYGWWSVGGYAWRLTNPVELPRPIMIRGAQGFYDWNGNLEHVEQKSQEADQGRAHG